MTPSGSFSTADSKMTGRADYPERELLLGLMVMSIFRLPISWHREEFEWIGCWVDIGQF